MGEFAVAGLSVARECSARGAGLHTGAEVVVAIRPRAEPGIVFVRDDLPGKPTVRASIANVGLELRRTVMREGTTEVQTAEHLLAVLFVLGIDRVEIHLTGPEVPGLDGSSLIWLEKIGAAGTAPGTTSRAAIRLVEAVAETAGTGVLAAVPNKGSLIVDYTLDHDSPLIPVQRVSFTIDPDTFAREIAPSRTFVLEREVAALLAAGLGRGASTQNTLVVGPQGVRDATLRFPDEFARHKVLDLLGDLALVEAALEARVVGLRSGHTLNAALARRLVALGRGPVESREPGRRGATP